MLRNHTYVPVHTGISPSVLIRRTCLLLCHLVGALVEENEVLERVSRALECRCRSYISINLYALDDRSVLLLHVFFTFVNSGK